MSESPDEVARLEEELERSRRVVVELEIETRRLREEITRFRTSAAGRLAFRLQHAARALAPYGTRRQRALHATAQTAVELVDQGPRALVRRGARMRASRTLLGEFPDTPDGRRRQYQAWLTRHDPRGDELAALGREETAWTYRPTVSVVMPVRDPHPDWLAAAIGSVRAQVYPHWQLCIADDGSSNPSVRAILERNANADERIVVRFRGQSGGIVAATSEALALATGDWIGFLDHDDVLSPHALHECVALLDERPDTDLVYSDEDKLLPSGQRGDPLFKPDWSPEMLLSANYITHFFIARKRLVDAARGMRAGFDGSQDHDLLLRLTERTDRIVHVPKVLYTWRMVEGSVALSSEYKPLAREAGRRAVAEALQRRGLEGRVEFGRYPGFYNVAYSIRGDPSVAIIIPTRDRVELLRAAIDSITRLSTYPNYRVVVVNNQSRQADTLAYLRKADLEVVDFDAPFNFSTMVNAAAAQVEADHLVLFNNDVSVISPGWIEAMLGYSQKDDVGAVGARLVYPDGRAQHEGIVVGGLHEAANVEIDWPGTREVSAVTGACLMTRHSVFEQLSGFDESLPEAFNDVDYCLRLRAAGYRVIYTPIAELSHREGASRGRRIPAHDLAHFTQRWGDRTQLQDPYLNRNVLWPNPLRLRME